MTDALERGVAWLHGKRKAHLSRTVTYEREGRSVEVAATIGRKAYEVADAYGASVWVESTDFIVTATDLVIAGVRTLPEAGDRIHLAASEEERVFEVMAPGASMSHYAAADPYRTAWRIHTRHVEG